MQTPHITDPLEQEFTAPILSAPVFVTEVHSSKDRLSEDQIVGTCRVWLKAIEGNLKEFVAAPPNVEIQRLRVQFPRIRTTELHPYHNDVIARLRSFLVKRGWKAVRLVDGEADGGPSVLLELELDSTD